MAITKMKELGCKNIKLMILVAAPEGVQFIYDRHPDVEIYCAALDDHLNENGYIVPGLGDAGDRDLRHKVKIALYSFADPSYN